ncbi:MAG TPA: hypothetical protein VF816_09300 [Rhodocyclaceae bacterium]
MEYAAGVSPMLDVSWLLFIVASLALIVTSGQRMMVVMSRSIAQGAGAGVATAAGVSAGLIGHTPLATSLLAICIFACGSVSASQTITAGAWNQVPISDKPAPSRWEYETSRLRDGTGKEVRRGELVRIGMRIVAGAGAFNARDRHEMWVFAGAPHDEENVRRRVSTNSYRLAGTPPPILDTTEFEFSLGSASLRNALVGRRVGERFVALDRAEHGTQLPEFVPAKALIFPFDADDGRWAEPKWDKTSRWDSEGRIPFIELQSSNDSRRFSITLDIEVLESCPAKLFKKDGVMHQVGYKRGCLVHCDGGHPSSTERVGHLQWAAVEARCEGMSAPMRIEAGPLVYRSSLQDHLGTYSVEIPASTAVYRRKFSAGSSDIWLKGSEFQPRSRDVGIKTPDELDGTLWAMDNAIANEKDCVGKSAEFIEACRTHVRFNPPKPAQADSIVLSDSVAGKPNLLFARSRVLANTRSTVDELEFSSDSKTLMSRAGGTIALWSIDTGIARRISTDSWDVNAVALSPDGTKLAWGSMWRAGLANLRGERDVLPLEPKEVSWLKFTRDGKGLMMLNVNSMLSIWDIADDRKRADLIKDSQVGTPSLSRKTSDDAVTAALSRDYRTLAMASPDSTIRLWDLAKGKLTHTLTPDGKVLSLAFSPNGKLLASGGKDFRLWNVTSGKSEILVEPGNWSGFSKVAFSPDGKLLAARKSNTEIGLWDVATRNEVQTLPGSYSSFAFSPDGTLFATAKFLASSGKIEHSIEIWTFHARSPMGASR